MPIERWISVLSTLYPMRSNYTASALPLSRGGTKRSKMRRRDNYTYARLNNVLRQISLARSTARYVLISTSLGCAHSRASSYAAMLPCLMALMKGEKSSCNRGCDERRAGDGRVPRMSRRGMRYDKINLHRQSKRLVADTGLTRRCAYKKRDSAVMPK